MRSLIVLPLHNEEATIGAVLQAVQRCAPPDADVLVVDDGSTDGSAAILAGVRDVTVLRHDRRKGYGASLIHGFRWAAEHGYQAVVTLDCDGQHEPHLLPALLSLLERADIVSGSRYLPGADRGLDPPPERRRINRAITDRINKVTGLGITDAFCGFNAYRTTALRRLALDEPSYGMPLQLWVQASGAGLRVKEIPVGRIYRNLDRTFPAGLDDPHRRLRYYLDTIEREVRG